MWDKLTASYMRLIPRPRSKFSILISSRLLIGSLSVCNKLTASGRCGSGRGNASTNALRRRVVIAKEVKEGKFQRRGEGETRRKASVKAERSR